MGQGAKKQRPFPDGHVPQQGAKHRVIKLLLCSAPQAHKENISGYSHLFAFSFSCIF